MQKMLSMRKLEVSDNYVQRTEMRINIKAVTAGRIVMGKKKDHLDVVGGTGTLPPPFS